MSWGMDKTGKYNEVVDAITDWEMHPGLLGNVTAMEQQLLNARAALLSAVDELCNVVTEGEYNVSVHMGGHAHKPGQDSNHEFINISVTLARVVQL